MRKVRVEEWAQPAPGNTSVASEQLHSVETESYKQASDGLSIIPLFLSTDRWSSLSLSLPMSSELAPPRKSNSRNASAASITVPRVSCDEFLMCADVKKENTMHHYTINSAQNRWPCLQCTDNQQDRLQQASVFLYSGLLAYESTSIYRQLWKTAAAVLLWRSHTRGWRWKDLMTRLPLFFYSA